MPQEQRAIEVDETKSFYKAMVYCRNCRYDGEMEIRFGKQIHVGTCTVCGCLTLQAADASREPVQSALTIDWASDATKLGIDWGEQAKADLKKFSTHKVEGWTTGSPQDASDKALIEMMNHNLVSKQSMMQALGVPADLIKEAGSSITGIDQKLTSAQKYARSILDQPFDI